MMHTLDSSEFESFLSEDFSYSSQKVLTDMNSKDEFIEYIRPKLETIKKTNSSVYAELGVCPAYGHTDCLIMAQGDKSNLLGVAYASVDKGENIRYFLVYCSLNVKKDLLIRLNVVEFIQKATLRDRNETLIPLIPIMWSR